MNGIDADEHPEQDDSPRDQPQPDSDEQNQDYPNGDEVSEDDHGRAVG